MIKYITFDCYDTLVAYSAGKASAIKNIVLQKGGNTDTGKEAVELFARTERSMHESADFKPLSIVLRTCLKTALKDQGLAYEESDGETIIQAVRDSRPFDDVAAILTQLRQHFKIAILSNSEQAIIDFSVTKIGVPFDQVVLAEQVKCYKPDLRMFQTLLERCECNVDEIVHVAQGFYHDIIPGHAMGLRRIWINRNQKTGDDAYKPYDELSDLTDVPALLGI